MIDCIIVGGGPAGLSAALLLGRCRRTVLVCDDGRPRNGAARAVHNFLSREPTSPAELRQLARDQLSFLPHVEFRDVRVTEARIAPRGFEVDLATGERLACRKLLLATGVHDQLPPLEGIESLYGISVHHCPYCDGYENRDRPLAVYGQGKSGAGLALTVSNWSPDVVLCTDGDSQLSHLDRQRLQRRGIAVRLEKMRRLEGREGRLEQIVFEEGPPLARWAMFIHTEQVPQSDLAARLGCRLDEKGCVETGTLESTNVSGLYVAGDASRDVQLVAVAAGEGTRAAFAMNKTLIEENLLAEGRRARGR